MKSTVLTFGLIFYMATCIAQKSSLNFSVQGSSSHILFIKDRPSDNYYVGISGAQRNYHFTPKMGAALEYVRSFSEKKNLSYGIGLRYAQKGQNINYYDTLSIRTQNGIRLIPVGGEHKAIIHYLQVPMSVLKTWNIRGHTHFLKFSILPEMNIYGYDNYKDMAYFHFIIIDGKREQKKYGLSSSLAWNRCFSVNSKDKISLGLYMEYQLSRYWNTNGNKREFRFGTYDPEVSWADFSHLARTHLFNIGIEVGYSFGLGKEHHVKTTMP